MQQRRAGFRKRRKHICDRRSSSMQSYVLVLRWQNKMVILLASALILSRISLCLTFQLVKYFASDLAVFGIHDCGNNTSSMYCWPESLAHKGSNDVVSCLDNYFQSRSLPAEVDTLYLFSDSCSGQNKNSTVIQYLYSLVRNGHFRCIRHILPVRGHSFFTL